MTQQEAKAYLIWYGEKTSEYHYLARFKSSRPFHVDYPNASKKRNEALITLGKHQWQKPYEMLMTNPQFSGLTKEKYLEYRKKHGINN